MAEINTFELGTQKKWELDLKSEVGVEYAKAESETEERRSCKGDPAIQRTKRFLHER